MSSFEEVLKCTAEIQILNAQIEAVVKALKWAGLNKEQIADNLVHTMDLTPDEAKSAVTICY